MHLGKSNPYDNLHKAMKNEKDKSNSTSQQNSINLRMNPRKYKVHEVHLFEKENAKKEDLKGMKDLPWEHRFNEEEIHLMNELFTYFDTHSEDYIRNDYIGAAVRALGYYLSDEELKNFIGELDKDCQGEIHKTVLFQGLLKLDKEIYRKEVMSCFDIFDKENNCMVNISELEYLLCRIGDKLKREEEAKVFTAVLDYRGTGWVKYDELVNILSMSHEDVLNDKWKIEY